MSHCSSEANSTLAGMSDVFWLCALFSLSPFLTLLLSLLAQLNVNMTAGKIRCNKRGIVLSRAEDRVSTRDGERGLYQYLSAVQGLGGFQDHFDWYV